MDAFIGFIESERIVDEAGGEYLEAAVGQGGGGGGKQGAGTTFA